MKTIYATKTWAGDFKEVLNYHARPDLVIGNNLGFEFVDMGNTTHPYYHPEYRALVEADRRGATHILWFASDAQPQFDVEVFKSVALPLLKDYPIVRPFWSEPYASYVDMAERDNRGGFRQTEFGFETEIFSDHAYLAKVKTMLEIDYETVHDIRQYYPQHGGNSFECRVAQWLATKGKKSAVLKDFSYKHTTKDEKHD